MRRPARVWLLSAILPAAAGGCAVGPDFHQPAAPVSAAYAPGPAPSQTTAVAGVAGGQVQTFVAGTTPAQWWRSFGSAELDAMVEEALKTNSDVKSAEAALRQAQALSRAQQGAELPSADFNYQAQRAKQSDVISPLLTDNSQLYTLHTAQVTVNYALDLFGGLRRQTEAAAAQADVARYQYAAARETLAANVVAAAIQSAALARQVEEARQTAADAGQIMALMQQRVRLGENGPADVAAQEAQLAQADQALPPLLKSLDQQQSALAILLGREPGQGAPAPLDLDRLTLPAQLPVTAPADLVRRRPDVGAADANLHAASANVGVAVAARLPNISLSAVGGGASTELRSLLTSGNQFWTLTGNVAQPIFDAGQLKQKQRAAEAAFDQAQAQYRGAVLSALKNVADSLDALTRDADALKAAAAAEAAGQRSLNFAERSRQVGEVGALEVLNAEQTYAQARAALAVASAARFSDTTALYQALGGGV